MNATAEATNAATPRAALAAVAASPPAEATAPATVRRTPALKHADIDLLELKQNDFVVVAAPGAAPEDYHLVSRMWSPISQKLHRGDLARMFAFDASWWGLFLVTEASATYANAMLLMATDIPAARSEFERTIPDGYAISQGTPGQEPWVVTRVSDGYVINVNQFHQRYEDALRWLKDHAALRGTPQD